MEGTNVPQTINVKVINSTSSDEPLNLQLPAGTTLGGVLNMTDVADGMSITVRNAQRQVVTLSREDSLETGSVVTITPENIKGA